ncbi:hypothetical protein KM043_013791 [Ampulex compressa]|nr:hypothetical protein KM043_013791 [Ampulex compressa]
MDKIIDMCDSDNNTYFLLSLAQKESKEYKQQDHMAITPESSLTIAIRTWILMLIFCFAGCAAGSCLSYGHSCWGAHGKRSEGSSNNNAQLEVANGVTREFVQRNAPASEKEEWILSRLIARRPLILLTDKYRKRWNGLQRASTIVPQEWDIDEIDISRKKDDSRSGRNEDIGDDDVITETKMGDLKDLLGGASEKLEEIPEVLLLSSKEYDNQGKVWKLRDYIKYW